MNNNQKKAKNIYNKLTKMVDIKTLALINELVEVEIKLEKISNK